MRATIFPSTAANFRPAFWGVDRDLSDVVDRIESIWEDRTPKTSAVQAEFKETDKAYLVAIDMPGVNKKDLSLEIEGNKILVSGARKRSLIGESEETQTVSRVVTIPQNVDKDKIQAQMEDGVLYLAMPKLEKEKPKKVELTENLKSGLWTKLLDERMSQEQ